MQKKALVIIDIQNDITKHYKDIIDHINQAVDWAVNHNIHVVYIRQEYTSDTMKKFKPNTYGSEFSYSAWERQLSGEQRISGFGGSILQESSLTQATMQSG